MTKSKKPPIKAKAKPVRKTAPRKPSQVEAIERAHDMAKLDALMSRPVVVELDRAAIERLRADKPILIPLFDPPGAKPRHRYRSAITGWFVSAWKALRNPRTTVKERVE